MSLVLRLLLPIHIAFAAVPAASQTGAPTSPPATEAAAGALQEWWRDHRWRYLDDAAATVAFRELQVRQSPWPDWHQSHIVTLPVGRRFQMVIAPGQSPEHPGAFGTFDQVPNLAFVRGALAVKLRWKPEIDRVVTYEVTSALLVDVGTVGPQLDERSGRYLPGGASQFQILVPAVERMAHLRVVEVRSIR